MGCMSSFGSCSLIVAHPTVVDAEGVLPPGGLVVGRRPCDHLVDLDAWPIGSEGGELAGERDRLSDGEVRVERGAIGPALDEYQTVRVVDVVVDIVTDASGFGT